MIDGATRAMQRTRLALMQESNQIGPDVVGVVDLLLQSVLEPMGTATFGLMVTHVALSVQRLKEGVEIEAASSVLEEARCHPDLWQKAKKLLLGAAGRWGGTAVNDMEVACFTVYLALLEQERVCK